MAASGAEHRFKFQALPEFFFNYSEQAHIDPSYRAVPLPGMGLVSKSYITDSLIESKEPLSQWERFALFVDHLNTQERGSKFYKVLYITRHGLGYHNVFEAQVGREAWNNHWSHLDGDGTVTWADSHLNEDGIAQARTLSQVFSKAVTTDKMPLPGTIYTSPLARCLETTRLVFSDVFQEQGVDLRPVVKEALREKITDHTCDRRSSQSWIKEHYPNYIIEPGFSEEDTLWTGSHWESNDEHKARKQQVLEEIFLADKNNFIALTTHSYAISAILEVVGLSHFRVREGGSIAMLVQADKVDSIPRVST